MKQLRSKTTRSEKGGLGLPWSGGKSKVRRERGLGEAKPINTQDVVDFFVREAGGKGA